MSLINSCDQLGETFRAAPTLPLPEPRFSQPPYKLYFYIPVSDQLQLRTFFRVPSVFAHESFYFNSLKFQESHFQIDTSFPGIFVRKGIEKQSFHSKKVFSQI